VEESKAAADGSKTGSGSAATEHAATENLSHQIPFRDSLMVSVVTGLGYGFDAYAVNIYGLVLPLIAVSLGADSVVTGLIGSALLVGYTIGTVGFGFAADKFGRKDTLGVSILLYGATTTLAGLTHNIPFFAAMRFLTGVGGAGELAVGAPYTAEMWPAKVRALGVGGIMFSFYSAGYILTGLAALYIVPRYGWEWAFIIAIVPALAIFALRLIAQESVRYVIAKTEHKFEAARALQAAQEEGSTRDRARAVRAIENAELQENSSREDGRHERLWHIPGVKKRIGIGWLLFTANTFGYWALTVFLTTFMVEKFGASLNEAIGYAIMFYVVQFFFSYLGAGLSDWIGRRPAGIIGALLMMTVTILAATANSLPVFLIFGAIMIAMLGWLWAIGDTYVSEIFPTRVRGSCFGISVGGGRLVSISAPFLVGSGIAAFGPTVPLLASAGLWVLTIIGYLLGPETSGKELEEIEEEMAAT